MNKPQPQSDTIPVQRIARKLRSGDFAEVAADPNAGISQHFVERFAAGERGLEVSVGYRRCHDFDPANQSGQDFAVVRYTPQFLVGVVADGVSRSFYGQVAATNVAHHLSSELWERRKSPPVDADLEVSLKGLQPRVAEELNNIEIPRHLPRVQIETLEKVRLKGTQAVFSAFVFDIRNELLTLYTVGDVAAVIHCDRQSRRAVESDKKGRWSSAGKSDLLLRREVIDKPIGLVLRSDGAAPDWGDALDSLGSPVEFGAMAEKYARADDVSFIGFRFVEPSLIGKEPDYPKPVPAASPRVDENSLFWPELSQPVTSPAARTPPQPVAPPRRGGVPATVPFYRSGPPPDDGRSGPLGDYRLLALAFVTVAVVSGTLGYIAGQYFNYTEIAVAQPKPPGPKKKKAQGGETGAAATRSLAGSGAELPPVHQPPLPGTDTTSLHPAPQPPDIQSPLNGGQLTTVRFRLQKHTPGFNEPPPPRMFHDEIALWFRVAPDLDFAIIEIGVGGVKFRDFSREEIDQMDPLLPEIMQLPGGKGSNLIVRVTDNSRQNLVDKAMREKPQPVAQGGRYDLVIGRSKK
jgi:hypothetical protein